MAVSLTQIIHGSTGWDRITNENFSKLNQDTGIVDLTMVGSTKKLYDDNPGARRINGIVHLVFGIIAQDDITDGTKILTIPDEFMGADGGITTLARSLTEQVPFPVTIRDGGMFVAKLLPKDSQLAFSGIIYAGKDLN